MLGENILQTLQKIVTLSHRLDEIGDKVARLDESVNARLEKNDDRFRAFDDRLRALEVAVGRLEEARTTQRETVRAEIATAIAELRVRSLMSKRSEGKSRLRCPATSEAEMEASLSATLLIAA